MYTSEIQNKNVYQRNTEYILPLCKHLRLQRQQNLSNYYYYFFAKYKNLSNYSTCNIVQILLLTLFTGAPIL